MENLKQQLLNIGLCVDNNFLDSYLQLLSTQYSDTTELLIHHIIPRFYFRRNKLKLDNSSSNVVSLSVIDHIRAHIYLYLCITDKYEYAAACPVNFMLTSLGLTIDSFLDIIDYSLYNDMLRDYRKHVSNISKNRQIKISGTTNKKAINNGEITKFVSSDEISNYLAQGWVVGTTSSGTKNRIVIHNNNRLKYVTQDVVQTYLDNGWKKRFFTLVLSNRSK